MSKPSMTPLFPAAAAQSGLGNCAVILLYVAASLKDFGSQWFRSRVALAVQGVGIGHGLAAVIDQHCR
jgi:hypothetical protein